MPWSTAANPELAESRNFIVFAPALPPASMRVVKLRIYSSRLAWAGEKMLNSFESQKSNTPTDRDYGPFNGAEVI
jgi:hypothetical protein